MKTFTQLRLRRGEYIVGMNTCNEYLLIVSNKGRLFVVDEKGSPREADIEYEEQNETYHA